MRDDVQKLLQSHFRPEFLNRVDEIVIFDALSVHQMRDIVDIQLSGLRSRLHERRVSLELTDAAKDHLASVGYDPAFGARPLKRAIGRELETPLAKKILAGEVPESSIINVDFLEGRLEFGLKLSN